MRNPGKKALKLQISSGDSIWRIYRTKRGALSGIKQLLKRYPQMNYVVGWKDVKGWGVELSVARWALEQTEKARKAGAPPGYYYRYFNLR